MTLSKSVVMGLLIGFSSSVFSEIIEVYTWKAFPGKNAEMIALFSEAKALHGETGASVSIVQQMTGSTQEIDYVMRWDNPVEWGKSMDKNNELQASAKWQSFFAKASANPVGEMVASNSGANLDFSKAASDFDGSYVYGVWVWDVAPGRNAEFIESAMESKKIHESMGARVEVYQENVGGTGLMHYVMMWETYSDWSESVVKMGSSEAWSKYLAESDPSLSTLVAPHRGQTIVSQ